MRYKYLLSILVSVWIPTQGLAICQGAGVAQEFYNGVGQWIDYTLEELRRGEEEMGPNIAATYRACGKCKKYCSKRDKAKVCNAAAAMSYYFNLSPHVSPGLPFFMPPPGGRMITFNGVTTGTPGLQHLQKELGEFKRMLHSMATCQNAQLYVQFLKQWQQRCQESMDFHSYWLNMRLGALGEPPVAYKFCRIPMGL